MLEMTEIQSIRELYFEEGRNISEIQNFTGRVFPAS